MATIVNPKFIDRIEELVRNSQPIDQTLTFNKAAAWLVAYLSQMNIPFKVYNLGAGAKRITTQTDVCPCCKRKL